MPISISQPIRRALPEGQRAGIADWLRSKSAGRCHLCDEPFNWEADVIEADHDEPQGEGGSTDRSNLWLAHKSCNAVKRDHPSIDMRPYLRLRAFVAKAGGDVTYGQCVPHFKITPKPTTVLPWDDRVEFHFASGAIVETPVFSEVNDVSDFHYCFVEVPKQALYNDDPCQPRAIRLPHVRSIYADLSRNPLHEPPSARLTKGSGKNRYSIAMFDGQHKTLATWLKGRTTVVCKVYLDLSLERANYLVNSIQSRIPKLPLSVFELAAKMGDEFRARFQEYQRATDGEGQSEAGFIRWLPPADRKRGKLEIENALINSVTDRELEEEFPMLSLVRAGKISETAFKNRVLRNLLRMEALPNPLADAQVLRQRERDTLIRAMNVVYELGFEPASEDGASIQSKLRAERLAYQAGLDITARRIKGLIRHVAVVDDEKEALTYRDLNQAQWKRVRAGIKRFIEHPIWTFDPLDDYPKTHDVADSMSKNQNVVSSFDAVGLRVGYMTEADQLPSNWYE